MNTVLCSVIKPSLRKWRHNQCDVKSLFLSFQRRPSAKYSFQITIIHFTLYNMIKRICHSFPFISEWWYSFCLTARNFSCFVPIKRIPALGYEIIGDIQGNSSLLSQKTRGLYEKSTMKQLRDRLSTKLSLLLKKGTEDSEIKYLTIPSFIYTCMNKNCLHNEFIILPHWPFTASLL